MTYKVVKGDTLIGIGKKLKLNWHEIASENNLREPYVIKIGQILKLPGEKVEVDKDMKISSNGLNLIKQFEGVRLTSYQDSGGTWTIGWGHTGNVRAGQHITQVQADDLLKQDVQRFVNGVNSAVRVPLTQNQFDALVSFTYNLGVGTLQKSTMLQLINAKRFTEAANEFDKYVHAGGKVLPGLVKRRKVEKDLFLGKGGSGSDGATASPGNSGDVASSLGSKVTNFVKSPVAWVGVFALLLFKA